jgi:glycerol-3-phosphate dehydrogenase
VHDVAVIGGGVVGVAVALALARRGADTVLLEARDELAGAASGTNSGILHTGFDSTMDDLETRLILRSGELRDAVVTALGIPVRRCGALVRGVEAANGVEATRRDDGTLEVPGESITDPVHFTRALAAAATACGAEIRTGVRVSDRREVRARAVVNCAGLYADEVARLYGDDSFEIYPRKGEFFAFDGIALDRILLPTPTKRTKGVLVFPTLDGTVVAGPTAHDQTDKEDWSVRPEALAEVRAKAAELLPDVAGAEPIGSWAGLRPAGRGCNYVIGRSRACAELVNVAAIRSTGLTASLGIAEHVATIVIGERPEAPLPAVTVPDQREPWWRRS